MSKKKRKNKKTDNKNITNKNDIRKRNNDFNLKDTNKEENINNNEVQVEQDIVTNKEENLNYNESTTEQDTTIEESDITENSKHIEQNIVISEEDFTGNESNTEQVITAVEDSTFENVDNIEVNNNTNNNDGINKNTSIGKIKNGVSDIFKDKKITHACIISAVISSLVSITGTTIVCNTINKQPTINTDIALENISVKNIGEYLEDENIIDNNSMFSLDYTFDSRFETFKEDITEMYTKVSNSDDNFKEVFIIKSDNAEKIAQHLELYKETLIEKYNNKDMKKTLSIVKNSIISSKQGIVYFIASDNNSNIEKAIINKINMK